MKGQNNNLIPEFELIYYMSPVCKLRKKHGNPADLITNSLNLVVRQNLWASVP